MKIFHHDDMDGRSAAAIIAASLKLPYLREIADKYGELSMPDKMIQLLHEYETKSIFNECDYASHIIDPSCICGGEDVYVVDYSFSKKTIDLLVEICKRAGKVYWYDHHLSSKDLITTHPLFTDNSSFEVGGCFENLTFDIQMNVSGAMLAWYNTMSASAPLFVQYISDYDCWLYEHGDDTTYFKLGVDMQYNVPESALWTGLITDAIVEQQIDIGYDIDMRRSYLVHSIIAEGKVAKKYIDCQNRDYYNRFHFRASLAGITCDCINWKTNSWVFGNNYGSTPLSCTFAYNGDVWTYTIFSKDPDINCAAIAEAFGGGGHKGVAGFSTKICLFDEHLVNNVTVGTEPLNK